MARKDYWDDPRAPRANSLVPAASAVLTLPEGRLVLQRRVDNDLWALPGGTMDIGERIDETVIREVREETGLTCTVKRIVGIYSDPRHVFAYSDGEVRQEFSICFECSSEGGVLVGSSESHEVRAFDEAELVGLPMHPRIRLRLDDFLAHAAEPFLR